MPKISRKAVIWILGLAALLFLTVAPTLYADLLWFTSLGFEAVFLKVVTYRIGLFLVFSTATFASLYAGYRVAVRNVRKYGDYNPSPAPLLASLFVSLLAGLTYSNSWDVVLRYLEGVPFGVVDPIYGADVAFYVFDIPLYRLLVNYVILVTLASLGISLWIYLANIQPEGREEPEPEQTGPWTGEEVVLGPPERFDLLDLLGQLSRYGFGQLSVYVGILLLAAGANFYLDRFDLLFSTRGVVFGAGATDMAVYKPVLEALAAISVGGGILSLFNSKIGEGRYLVVAVLAVVVVAILGNLGAAAYQNYVVGPDEFNKERGFIENEIDFTRKAFGLDRIQETDFDVARTLTRGEVENNTGTIRNVRLWDPRPLLKTYNELQIFRTYYTFNDVDVDRYSIGGEETQVMLSAREMDTDALSENSRTWVNRHLVYTHGYGAVMSPVENVSSEGLPEFYIKDIPPNSTAGIKVGQPRIYYGEGNDDYAIVKTGTREFDYPSGSQNVYNNYSGNGGVELSNFAREVAYTVKFSSPQIFLSDSVDPGSRIQLNRDPRSRARELAPFLRYDSDPYLVIADGRLYWILDAYTTTHRYPYSKRIAFKGSRENYVRNSVKVVVDAYTGETDFYVAEEGALIDTYREIFPSLFEDFDSMPEELRKHVRYPEDAFEALSTVYLDYHMRDPKVFYNKEDSWRIPDEISRGDRIRMEAYYVVLRFPGEREPEFVLMRPFIPRGKENMIGWMAARCDTPNYGRLKSFLFSKQRLIYGPMQIESRIDQDTEISQRITLWSEAGSRVIRGNLLAIPIDKTVLYVEPLYLESAATGAIPELKRVIVAQGDSLTMQPTLERAIEVRFGKAPEEPEPVGEPGAPPQVVESLRQLYVEAQEALRRGDFETYAERITRMGGILENRTEGR